MSQYFLGIDGGQSSTVAAIGDESGRIAGWATAGPCNHVAADEAQAKFRRVIGDCVSQAVTRAGLDPDGLRFRAACLGMSGGVEDKQALLREIVAADRLLVTHDARIALAGALNGAAGTVVIAGTGSIAYAENERGETARAGGWGYIFGDEGGGFDIARQALRAILRQHEGWGPRTALTPALLEATGTSEANAALHKLYTPEWPKARTATLAPIVGRIAEEGDPVAIEILRSAAQNLAMLAATVRRQLWSEESRSALSWIGGVFKSTILLERFRLLADIAGSVSSAPPIHSPAVGALILALRISRITALPEPNALVKT